MTTPTSEQIRSKYEELRPAYVAFSEGLRPLLTQLCEAEHLPVDTITARVKDATSLTSKFTRKGKNYGSLADITDKCGLRIVTRYESTVAPVLDLLAREFEIVEAVHHRGIAPDVFGYQSEHVLIKMREPRADLPEWKNYRDLVAEVQVRSILQHAWASISHSLDYKSEQQIPAAARRRLFRVAAMLETADEIFDTYREEVEDLRSDYASGVQHGEWQSLAIDSDSLKAAWDKLPVQGVLDAALEAGFADPGWITDQNRATGDWFDLEAGMLIDASQPAGLRTLGDMDAAMRAVISNVALLRRYADLTDELASHESGTTSQTLEGPVLRVFAIVPDVVVFHLIMTQPTNHALSEIAYAQVAKHLVDAAIRVGLEKAEEVVPRG